MVRTTLFLAVMAFAPPVLAEDPEPGEWQFTTVTTTAGEKPQTETEKECLKKEDMADKTGADPALPPGCKMKTVKQTATSRVQQLECPNGLRQTYSTRWTRTTLEVEIESAPPGEKPTRLKMSGRRIGPCK